MFDTIDAVTEFLDAVFASHPPEYATEYGEPGYSDHGIVHHPYSLIVLGYYWCRCPVFDPHDPHPLHGMERHYPETFKRLESLGVNFEWSDEWIVDGNGKAYRTQPDSHSWLPSYVISEGELITRDDDINEWIAYASNEPSHAIPSHIYNGADLEREGFRRHNGTFETGWHPGQNADPSTVAETIRELHGEHADIVFVINGSGQFDLAWSAYWRPAEGQCLRPHCAGDADDVDATDGYCPACVDAMERVAGVIDDGRLGGSNSDDIARELCDAGLIGGVSE